MEHKTSYQKGIEAENLACKFLLQNNFIIIAKRIKNKAGEIDILAQNNEKKEDYYIIEVKKRKTLDQAKEAISQRQITRSINSFYIYIQEKNLPFENIYIKAIVISQTKISMINIVLDEFPY